MPDINILIELYKWVIDPLNGNCENETLKNKLSKYFSNLPAQIQEYKEPVEYSYDGFIMDMFNYIDYSNKIIFKLLNNGRKYLLKCLKIVLFLLIPALIAPLFLSRLLNISDNIFLWIIAGIIVLMGSISLLIDKITAKILQAMKPGDLLKILDAEDENFPITKVERSLGPNAYENVTIVESKKKIICQRYRELVNIDKTKNLYKLIVYYFATDYLISIENNEEIIIEYRKEVTRVLEYILAFKRESSYVLFYLAHNELNLLSLDNSLKYFKEYQKLYQENINVNAWIIVLEFIKENPKLTLDTEKILQ